MVFPRWTVWLAGRRVPRFLPVVPVWLIAPTLAGYGTGMGCYLLFSGPSTFPDYLLSAAAATAFAGYGWTLGVAAVSYQRRTRPRCVLQVVESGHQRPARAGSRRGQGSGGPGNRWFTAPWALTPLGLQRVAGCGVPALRAAVVHRLRVEVLPAGDSGEVGVFAGQHDNVFANVPGST